MYFKSRGDLFDKDYHVLHSIRNGISGVWVEDHFNEEPFQLHLAYCGYGVAGEVQYYKKIKGLKGNFCPNCKSFEHYISTSTLDTNLTEAVRKEYSR